MFQLHPKLEADTREITRLNLCRVLLMNDRRYPWLILVPERAEIREIHQLSAADRATLIEEVAGVAEAMERLHKADKMNVAALGNQVPQLHVHVIARFTTDPAWPGPIWGKGSPAPYDGARIGGVVDAIRRALGR
ncbi:MAG: HIT domain-containing protein [Alphaproteobacteria bacterium]|nr:HIT domain-containing protein [Alphaproteobacteria bacterium]